MEGKRRKHQHIDEKIKNEAIIRLNRLEGQIRGIARMVQRDDYCQDILNQFASVKAGINSVRDLLLQDHIQHCIADKMTLDKQAATEELIAIVKKISK